MYIVIVGAGEVGTYLARILVDDSHDVAIIESDDAIARSLESELDALVLSGSGVSHNTLRRAGVRKADLVIAATSVDEVNLIVAMNAAKLGKDGLQTIARVRDSSYLAGEEALSAQELGLSLLVGPELSVANRVIGLLSFQGSGEIRYLADGRVTLLGLTLSDDSPFVHDKLSELRGTFPEPSLVVAVHGPKSLVLPNGETRLRVNERVDVLTTPENVDELLILSGRPWHHVRDVLLIGCGTIGFSVAKQLESRRIYPTIIEVDPERAAYVARRLSRSVVLCHDGTDINLLREQMAERADAVVVLLESDHDSMVAAAFCKHLGAKKVISRVDQLAYAPIAHRLGIDALISPSRAIADAILRYVRRGSIDSLAMLGDHEAELIELHVEEGNEDELLNRPLRELDLPKGSMIGAVMRDGEVELATGDTILRVGDSIMVIAKTEALGTIERRFG